MKPSKRRHALKLPAIRIVWDSVAAIPSAAQPCNDLEVPAMERIVLASGILRRGGDVLLVQCRYPGEEQPLWTLPGGRQAPGEPLRLTVRREFFEETTLDVEARDLAYVSESVDASAHLHVINCTFWMHEHEPHARPEPNDPAVVNARFVPTREAPSLLAADVLRVPVSAALGSAVRPRYFFFDASLVDVPFFNRRLQRPR